MKNFVEEYTEQEVLDMLTLQKGHWVLPLQGDIYRFPQHVTKEQAMEVIREAFTLFIARFN